MIAETLAAAAALGVERLDAQLLLLHALDRSAQGRAWLLAHDREPVDATARQRFAALCERRAAGEPLSYLIGWREFHGLRLRVDARVLDPRPDTETLVDWALELLAGRAAPPPPHVIDLGTGSGAVALAIKRRCPQARVAAVDASGDALDVARGNAAALGLDVAFARGDWLSGVPGTFDLIVSNPPYIAQADPHLAALRHEPVSALVAGADGLDALRSIVRQAPQHLAPGGWLLLEHGHEQAAAVRGLLDSAGFTQVRSRRDLAGIERCSGARYVRQRLPAAAFGNAENAGERR